MTDRDPADAFRAFALAAITVLSVVSLSMGAIPVAAAAQSNTTISDCTTINSPGVYQVDGDISSSSGTCIEITSGDVVLDGQSNAIDLSSSGEGVNVTSSGSISNVTVRNLMVNGGAVGMTVHAPGDGATVTDIAFVNNHLDGTDYGMNLTADGSQSTVDFEIADTRMRNVSGHGIEVVADGADADVTVAITGNDIVAGDEGIDDIDADGKGTSLTTSIVGNSITSDSGETIQTVDANADDQTVDVVIKDNALTAEYEGIEDVEANGVGTQASVSILNNTIDAGSEGIGDVQADAGDQTVDVEIVGNNVTAAQEGISDVEADGDNTQATITIADNVIATDQEGIQDVEANSNNQTVDIAITGNDITGGYEGIEDVLADGTDTEATITIADNVIDAGEEGINDVEGDYDNQTLDIAITGNDITAVDEGIDDIDVDGIGTEASVSILDNVIDAGEEGIDDVEGDGDEQTINLAISGNDVTAGYEGIRSVQVDGIDATVNVSVVGNAITAGADGTYDGILEITTNATVAPSASANTSANTTVDADLSNPSVTVVVADNEIDATRHGIGAVDLGPSNQTVDVAVVGNHITGFSGNGIEFESVPFDDGKDLAGLVRANTLVGNDSSQVGVLIDPIAGTESSPGEFTVEYNDIRTADTAVGILDGPVDGIGIHENYLGGDSYGVANGNTTTGSFVDATDNYWAADDGPGSAGPFEDPVTGALANGSGSEVTGLPATMKLYSGGASDVPTTTASNVHFDPYLTVEPDENFTVELDSTNSPVDEGETLTVEATVANQDVGADRSTQTVELVVGGAVRDSKTVTLGAQESETVTLSWATDSNDGGNYTATVASANDSDSTEVRVFAPPNFALEIDGTNAPVTEGETVTVEATVQNTGDVEATRTLTLTIGGFERASTTLTLGPEESETVTLSWATAAGDAGSYTAVVDSEDDTERVDVTVEEEESSSGPPTGEVTDTPTPTETPSEASVSISDQQATDAGTVVTVDQVTLEQGGFVVIHQGQGGPVIGVSDYLEPGVYQDVTILLDEEIDSLTGLVAMAHRDTNGNEQWDFVTSGGEDDVPYMEDGEPVTDSAAVTGSSATATPDASTDSPTEAPTEAPTETATPTETSTDQPSMPTDTPTEGDTPGFGPVVAFVALLAAALLAVRRKD
jgi:PGF-CTERM protein